jgi:outer membrane biosynthesis protein TonB
MMLCEAMTRQLPQLSVDGGLVVPDSLPRSLASIAQECLRFNPDRRCTISDMIARLAPGLTLPPEILSPGRWAAHPTPSPAREDPRPADPLPSGELAADGGKPNDIKPEGIQIVEAEVPLQPLSASGDGPRDGNNTQSPRSGAPPAPSRWEEDPPEEVNQFGPEPLRRGASAGNSQPRPASQWQSKWESDTSTPLPDLFKQFDDKEPRRFRVLPFLLVALVLLGLTGTILVRSGRIDLPTLEKLAQDKIASLTQSVSPQQQAQAPSPQPAESPAVTQAAAPPQTPPATQPDQPQPAPATETPSASPQQATTPPAGAEPQPASATPQPSQSATEAAPPQVPAAPPTPARTEEPLPASADGAVARQVMPSVSQAAIESMHGPVRVTLRVAVSRTGDVSSASYISPGEGNYFARIAHRAAEQWKFHAPRHRGRPDASTWTLRFNFTRDGVDVTAAQD